MAQQKNALKTKFNHNKGKGGGNPKKHYKLLLYSILKPLTRLDSIAHLELPLNEPKKEQQKTKDDDDKYHFTFEQVVMQTSAGLREGWPAEARDR